jgi:uncharacterized membrane protein
VAKGFWSDFRRNLMRGLAAVLPTALTVALIIWFFQKINTFISTAGMRIGVWIYGDAMRPQIEQFWDKWFLDYVGVLPALILIYLFGIFVASFIGRAIWRALEAMMMRVPLLKQIYPSVKQVTDFLLSERKLEFKRVVAVEYPRKGIWSIGLVTNTSMQTLHGIVGGELLTVFVPSSPAPFTGYTMTLRREEVVDLPITIEEALQFTISGGVIIPSAEQVKAPPQNRIVREVAITAAREA